MTWEESALRLAREATNGWACYAKRQIEHDEIARLHVEIERLRAEVSSPATPHSITQVQLEPHLDEIWRLCNVLDSIESAQASDITSKIRDQARALASLKSEGAASPATPHVEDEKIGQ